MSASIDDMNSLLGDPSPIDVGALQSVSPTANFGSSGLLGDLGNIAGGLLGIGGTAAEYGVASSQMNKTAQENQQLAQSLETIGQPFYNAGTSELGAFESGQLTTPFSTQVNAAVGANAQAATSQEQQVAQMLAGSAGGQNIEGAQASQTQEIQSQQNLSNQQALAQAFMQELQSATGLGNEGGQYISQGITSEIQSNTQLSGQMQQLMAAMAQSQSNGGGLGSSLGSLFGGVTSLLSFL